MKVVIVGCGKIADSHVEEVAKLPQATVVAVCDREPLMAEQLAVRYGVPAHYGDFEKMLERERPDVVHVTTPPQSHLALATTAAQAGCHVYVEKPPALTSADAKQLINAVQARMRKLTIGYAYHYDPPMETLRHLIAQGTLGEPVHIESYYGYNLAGSFGQALMSNPEHWVHTLPGKLFQNNIDHALIKLAEFISDDEPQIVAKAYRRRNEKFGDVRDEILEELRVIVLGSQTSAYVTFTSNTKPVSHFMRVYGTRRCVQLDFVSRAVILEGDVRLPGALGRALAPFGNARSYLRAGSGNVIRFLRSDFHYFVGMNKLLSLFYDSILNDTPPPIPYRDILRVAVIQDTIYGQISSVGKVGV